MAQAAERGDVGPPLVTAGEKDSLVRFLDYLRDSIAHKLDGLSEEEVRRALVPSRTTLMMLIKHLARVELRWFCINFAGQSMPEVPADPYPTDSDTIPAVLAAYRAAVVQANAAIAAGDLDQRAVRSRTAEPPTLRWILIHMIEETARHAGHADILREQIDGAVGR